MEIKLNEAKEYWSKLGDVCIDEEECIDTEFDGYPVGTDIYTIWHDIEEKFNVSIGRDLMHHTS